MEADTGCPLGDQGEHDIATIAVGELLARGKLGRVSSEHPQILLGGRELMNRDSQHIVGGRETGFLVEIVTDARSVCQQLLDRHLVVDQRQVFPEDRTSGRGRLESTIFEQGHHRQGGQSLGAAGDRELGIEVLATWQPRWASPYALASRTPSPRSTRTTPENPVSAAIRSTESSSWSMRQVYRRENEPAASDNYSPEGAGGFRV
jgi:hypothetical protein